jgi:hypothetical protein
MSTASSSCPFPLVTAPGSSRCPRAGSRCAHWRARMKHPTYRLPCRLAYGSYRRKSCSREQDFPRTAVPFSVHERLAAPALRVLPQARQQVTTHVTEYIAMYSVQPRLSGRSIDRRWHRYTQWPTCLPSRRKGSKRERPGAPGTSAAAPAHRSAAKVSRGGRVVNTQPKFTRSPDSQPAQVCSASGFLTMIIAQLRRNGQPK